MGSRYDARHDVQKLRTRIPWKTLAENTLPILPSARSEADCQRCAADAVQAYCSPPSRAMRACEACGGPASAGGGCGCARPLPRSRGQPRTILSEEQQNPNPAVNTLLLSNESQITSGSVSRIHYHIFSLSQWSHARCVDRYRGCVDPYRYVFLTVLAI